MSRYYVYTLAYPERYPDQELAGQVFYVGKGSKSRIMNHEADARNHTRTHTYSTPKSEIIRQIWQSGGRVVKQKIAFFETNEEAYAFEIELINSIGKAHLVNVGPGGTGCRGLDREEVDKPAHKSAIQEPVSSLAEQLQRYTSHARHRLVIDVDKARMLALLARQSDMSIEEFTEHLIEQAWQEAIQREAEG